MGARTHDKVNYRERWRVAIEQARAMRTERALTEGLALMAKRVAKLKEHAEVLDALRWVPDKNGRLWSQQGANLCRHVPEEKLRCRAS